MLEAGVRVLIYAGEKDIICNELGNRRWVDALPWAGSRAWAAAANVSWIVDGEEAGTLTEVGPLSFLSVKDAGHMVPMDQPENSLEMIWKFTRGESLVPEAAAVAAAGAGGAAAKGAGAAGVALRAGRRQGPFTQQAAEV